jgi:hypothetical protein
MLHVQHVNLRLKSKISRTSVDVLVSDIICELIESLPNPKLTVKLYSCPHTLDQHDLFDLFLIHYDSDVVNSITTICRVYCGPSVVSMRLRAGLVDVK